MAYDRCHGSPKREINKISYPAEVDALLIKVLSFKHEHPLGLIKSWKLTKILSPRTKI
ncbi:hypothetical protein BU16DRAFT_528903 [Lophium mytilinum]|uniref:Uncharacterized protein n=1 Tax=Lophium mytilinum TaxID=390894 RepID=A0A6A6QS15_9PEZI|nr:hypothetical protein BU16DRAFT_528903 [Lophium mytilinum]